jgi:hypothetical protein
MLDSLIGQGHGVFCHKLRHDVSLFGATAGPNRPTAAAVRCKPWQAGEEKLTHAGSFSSKGSFSFGPKE